MTLLPALAGAACVSGTAASSHTVAMPSIFASVAPALTTMPSRTSSDSMAPVIGIGTVIVVCTWRPASTRAISSAGMPSSVEAQARGVDEGAIRAREQRDELRLRSGPFRYQQINQRRAARQHIAGSSCMHARDEAAAAGLDDHDASLVVDDAAHGIQAFHPWCALHQCVAHAQVLRNDRIDAHRGRLPLVGSGRLRIARQ